MGSLTFPRRVNYYFLNPSQSEFTPPSRERLSRPIMENSNHPPFTLHYPWGAAQRAWRGRPKSTRLKVVDKYFKTKPTRSEPNVLFSLQRLPNYTPPSPSPTYSVGISTFFFTPKTWQVPFIKVLCPKAFFTSARLDKKRKWKTLFQTPPPPLQKHFSGWLFIEYFTLLLVESVTLWMWIFIIREVPRKTWLVIRLKRVPKVQVLNLTALKQNWQQKMTPVKMNHHQLNFKYSKKFQLIKCPIEFFKFSTPI